MKVHANGIDIHYAISGNGPWVTLSHSLFCDGSMWDPQMAALEAHFTVLRFDTRGHGRSDAPPGAYTLAQMADDALGLLDVLKVERTHFVGLSMGGMIGQHLALKAPQRIDRLVLADTVCRFPPEAQALWPERIRIPTDPGTAAMAAPPLARWSTAPYRAAQAEVMARITALIGATSGQGVCGGGQAIPRMDTLDRLHQLNTPTLVIVGEQDIGTPPAMSQEIAAAIPDARLEIIADASHLSNIEQADAFNRLLLEFLA